MTPVEPERHLHFDLDVDRVNVVPVILRAAASSYRDTSDEFSARFQNPEAGAQWRKIAELVDEAAQKIEILLKGESAHAA